MSEVESSDVKNKHIIYSDTAGHYKVFTKKGVSLNLITQHVIPNIWYWQTSSD